MSTIKRLVFGAMHWFQNNDQGFCTRCGATKYDPIHFDSGNQQ